jgi:hypothetical protein
MKLTFIALLVTSAWSFAGIPAVPESGSPDGKIHAVMDVDRDPKITPEWKGDSYPLIEITEKATGHILTSIQYFGSVGSDARPLREHVRLSWRLDSKAFAITINDRYYSSSMVFVLNKESKFVEIKFPSYEAMTGFPPPDSEHLRPRGRSSVNGWDSEGRLIYYIFSSPLPSYSGTDPLEHTVLLDVSAEGMVPVKKTKSEQGTHGDSH